MVATVAAHNSVGWGPTSPATESAEAAAIQVEPHQAETPSRGEGTSVSQVEVVWSSLTGLATGGSPVDSYHLQWDAGDSSGTTWHDLQGGSDESSYSQQSRLGSLLRGGSPGRCLHA